MSKKAYRILKLPFNLFKKFFFKITLNNPNPSWYSSNDCCGTFCVLFTWVLIFYGQYVFYKFVFPPWYNKDASVEKFILENEKIFAEKLNNPDLNSVQSIPRAQRSDFRLLKKLKAEVGNRNIDPLFSFDSLDSSFWALLNAFGFTLFATGAFIAHVRAVFTNPGTTEKNNATPESIAKMNLPPGHVLYKCTKCFAIKPERAHHCSLCKRCINKMDHHCPWINNCVGANNQKYFVLFTLYICLLSAWGIFIAIHRFISCGNVGWKSEICTFTSSGVMILNLVGLTFEAVLFFLFTAAMFTSQIWSICDDSTGIEQLKNDYSHKKKKFKNSKYLNFKAVFGDKFSYKWLLPFVEPSWAKTDMSSYNV